MKITLTPDAYSSKFHDIIHSWDRYIIAYGGRGSGKTDSFYTKYLLSLFEPYYFRLAYINKEKSNIRDQQYAGFKRVARRTGLAELLKFYDGDYRIVNTKNENMLVPRGMDDPEKTKGLDDITAIWWDEINKGEEDDFTALNELLRSPVAKYLQFAISFNPVDENHWLRKRFFHPDNPHSLHPDYVGKTLLNRSTYKDNEFFDPDEYYATLVDSAAGNLNKIRVNIEGDWGIEDNSNPWLYNFDLSKNVGEVPFLQAYPIYLSFDFNIDPFACTIWQMSPSKGGAGDFIHCIDEVVGELRIEDTCKIIKSRYPRSIIYVTGDRSGSNRILGANQTLYQSIATHLGLNNKVMNLNTHNLEHSDSRELINTMFWSYPSIKIHPRCKTLIRDCQIAKCDEKSKKPSHLLKDRGIYKMDAFDAMRYFFQTYFLEWVRKAYWRQKS